MRLRSTVADGRECVINEIISDQESLCFRCSGEADINDLHNKEIDAMILSLQCDATSYDKIKLLEFSNILNDGATTAIRERFCDRRNANSTLRLQSLRILENKKMTSHSAENLSLLVNYQLSSLTELDLSKNPKLFNEDSLKLLMETLHGSDCHIKRLNLSHNSIGKRGNAVEQISKLLCNNQSIQHLDLSHNCLGHNHMSSEGGLYNNRTLLELNLSSNNLRDAGVRIIMTAIDSFSNSMSILEKLYLSRNSIRCNGAKSIKNVLGENRNLSLKTLDLSYNAIGIDGSDHLRNTLRFNHTLKEVNLSGNKLCGTGNTNDGYFITDGLSCTDHSTLIRLDLAMAAIKDSGALAIANMVRNNGTLEILNLSNNSIQSDGMNAILDAVPHNVSLKELWLHCNKISDENMLVSFVCDVGLCNLEVLTYSNNNFNADQLDNIESAFLFHNNMKSWLGTLIENIKVNNVRDIRLLKSEVIFGDRELQEIVTQFVRQPFEITTVRLDGGNITDTSISHFAKHVIFNSGYNSSRLIHLYCYNLTKLRNDGINSIAQCLRVPTCSLRGLTLCNCNIGLEGATEIARCLEDNSSLTLLCLQSNQISDLGAKKIFAAVLEPPHPTLIFLNLSNNQLTDTALEGLGRFNRLVDVILNKNNISDRGVLDLCKAVMDTTSLRYLNMRDNPQITPRGIQTLQSFLPDPFVLDS